MSEDLDKDLITALVVADDVANLDPVSGAALKRVLARVSDPENVLMLQLRTAARLVDRMVELAGPRTTAQVFTEMAAMEIPDGAAHVVFCASSADRVGEHYRSEPIPYPFDDITDLEGSRANRRDFEERLDLYVEETIRPEGWWVFLDAEGAEING